LPWTRTIPAAALNISAACGGDGAGGGLAFDSPRTVSSATRVGAAPNFAVSPRGDEAVAWISAPDGGTDGRLYVSVNGAAPAEIRDSLGPIEAHGESPPKIAFDADGALHAIYVVGKVVPGKRFPLAALRHVKSLDGGATWTVPVRVTDDGDFGSHNFHALHVGGDGRVYVAWLDGRLGKSASYTAVSTDGGATWGTNVRASVHEACPCCRTAIASDTGGVVYLAWRTVLPGNVRDIVVARSTDGGASWGEAQRVHADDWVFDGCPHAGPSLAVDAQHRLHVGWWTGKPGRAGVFYARADDGVTFGAPVALATAASSRPSHVQLAVDGERVAVTWDDGFTQSPSVRVRVSRDAGATFGDEVRASSAERVASFPVIAFARGTLTLAWTEQLPEAHARAEASRPDMSDPGAVMGLARVGEAGVVVVRGVGR
jgi:hypothetical protein